MSEHSNNSGMEQVDRALAALREASLDTQTPEHVEVTLQQAFRAHHQRLASTNPRRTRRYALIAGALAASFAIVAAIRLSRTPVVNGPEPAVAAQAHAPEQSVATVRREVQSEPKRQTPVARPKPRPRRAAPVLTAGAPARREVTTDFFPMPYAPAMTQAEYGQVIRVSVPATSMRTFGLPVNEDRVFGRVQADVLMGEDGIARAIRFVRQQNSGLNYR